MSYVETISREWRYATNGAGSLTLILVTVELVWYTIQVVQWIVKKIRGKEQWVREMHNEWRSRRRERVIESYSPATDRKHPNYGGRR